LQELRAQQRRVLLLTYVYGYTHEELARILDIPVGTIKTWIRRSLQRLKRRLDE
jgi:RNA polymerase sigma-70 factor, ECF subfamily